MNTKTNFRNSSWLQLNKRQAAWTGMLLLLLALPATVHAQFNYIITNGTVTITGYTGPGGAVIIPSTIAGLPVTTIGSEAFYNCINLTSVTIPSSVTSIGEEAFYYCTSLTSVTIGAGVTSIGNESFHNCTSLTSVTIPSSVTRIGDGAFRYCSSLTSVTIPSSVTYILGGTFQGCTRLTNITIPSSVYGIGLMAFEGCSSLTSVTIPNSVGYIYIDMWAFGECTSLQGIYFCGNSPIDLGPSVFTNDTHVTVYYLPGTTGWRTTFGGRPTALWVQVPTIQTAPQTQTAEAGSDVGLCVQASSPLPLFYFWYRNATNLLSCGTNSQLELTNLQLAQSGAYTVVISNALGAITTSPALLNVIAALERRPVPGVKVTGTTGSLLNVDYASFLAPAPTWTMLGFVSLTNTSQYYFDLTAPLPPQRFYRAWQTNTLNPPSVLDVHLVPAITLTGAIGSSVRVDYINQFGPVDAWVTLDTVTLSSSPQLYFDTSSIGQPSRLYWLVPVP